jgi:uncharacterized protein (TIRG00374 family)
MATVPPSARKALGIGLRVAVLVAAVVFLARGVRWSDVLSTLRAANPLLIALVIALNACMMTLKAMRLRILLRPGQASTPVCFLALLTSSALNNVTPFRGGDVARLFMLERRASITKSAAVAVTVVEKVIEFCALGTLVLLGSLLVRSQAQSWALIAAPIVVTAAAFALWLLRRMARGWHASAGEGSKVGAALGRLEPGTRALSSRRDVVASLLLSFAAWSCEICMILVCTRAIGLSVGPVVAVTALLGVNLAIALPSAPASAGPFESAMVVVLTLAGLGKAEALAFALVYHVVQVVPVTVAGLAVLSRTGLTLGGAPTLPPPVATPVAE